MLTEEVLARFEQVVNRCSKSRHAFASKAGLNDVAFGDIFRKGNEPRFSTMVAIFNAFPQVSAEYLMRGEGDMFRTGEQHANVMQVDKPPRTAGGSGVAEESNSANADSTIVELLRKEVASLQEQLKEKGEQLKVKDEQIKAKDEQIGNKDAQIASLLAILSK